MSNPRRSRWKDNAAGTFLTMKNGAMPGNVWFHVIHAPQPNLILHLAKGKVPEIVELSKTPQWAKALAASAVKISQRSLLP
jgi:hypothetical protein